MAPPNCTPTAPPSHRSRSPLSARAPCPATAVLGQDRCTGIGSLERLHCTQLDQPQVEGRAAPGLRLMGRDCLEHAWLLQLVRSGGIVNQSRFLLASPAPRFSVQPGRTILKSVQFALLGAPLRVATGRLSRNYVRLPAYASVYAMQCRGTCVLGRCPPLADAVWWLASRAALACSHCSQLCCCLLHFPCCGSLASSKNTTLIGG